MIYRFISVIIFISVILPIYYLVLCHIDDGPLGEQGSKGDIGDIGPNGRIGVKGINGQRGPLGNRGALNNNTTVGPVGNIGDRGIKGIQGDRGIRNIDGDRGLKGNMGDNGIRGDNGIQGNRGIKGKPGKDNKLKFMLSKDNSKYEKETEIETKDSIAFKDFTRPFPGQTYSPTYFNDKFKSGIPLKSTNNNSNWTNFVTGFKLKGESITEDRAKTYYTNIKVIDPSEK